MTQKEELRKKFDDFIDKNNDIVAVIDSYDSELIFDFFYSEILAEKISHLESVLEAADEVAKYSRQLVLYSTHGEIVADYHIALEKYNQLKTKSQS